MKPIPIKPIISVCIICLLCEMTLPADPSSADVVQSLTFEKSYRGSVNGLNLVYLKGDQDERGRAHGYLLANEIISLINHLVDMIGSDSWNQILNLVKPPATFKFPSRFESEFAEILAGLQAALPPADRIINALGREIDIYDLKAMHCFSDAQCSQFAVWGGLTADGNVLIGRNLDYRPLVPPDLIFVVAVDPDEPMLHSTIDVGSAGSVGVGNIAMNDEGLYVAFHDGSFAAQVKQDAVPDILILRNLLETTAADQNPSTLIAQGLLEEKATFARILLVATPIDEGLPHAIEWDPNHEPPKAAIREPSYDPIAGGNALVLTNHFLVSNTKSTGSSNSRYDILKNGIETVNSSHEIIDFDKAKELLSQVDASSPDNTTLVSAIIKPDTRTMHVAIYTESHGSALNSEFTEVLWNDIFNTDSDGTDDGGNDIDDGPSGDENGGNDDGDNTDSGETDGKDNGNNNGSSGDESGGIDDGGNSDSGSGGTNGRDNDNNDDPSGHKSGGGDGDGGSSGCFISLSHLR